MSSCPEVCDQHLWTRCWLFYCSGHPCKVCIRSLLCHSVKQTCEHESVSSTFSEVWACASTSMYNISLCQGLHNVLQAGLPAHGFQQLLCQDRAAAAIVLMRRANGTCWVFLCARTAKFFCRRPLHGAFRLHCCIETDIDQTGGIWALWTRVTLGLGMCKVCTEAVHSVALWTRVTLGLGMCKVCTEAVHSVALWTRVTLGLGMCKVCTEAVHSVALWTRVTLGLGMCKVCTEAVHSVALWTRVTLGLGMCKVCTEAVHSVALWTRVTLGLGMCKVCTEAVHSVALWTRVTLGLGMCKVCTEAVHSVALWTRMLSRCEHVWSM